MMRGGRNPPPGPLQLHHRGSRMPVPSAGPRHQRQPGQEGYRTPVIEDPEHPANRYRGPRPSSRRSMSQTTTKFFYELYHGDPTSSQGATVPSIANVISANSGSTDNVDTDPRPKNLSWKQRMQHVTWAYFTLTMATGGIANVLSAGKHWLPTPPYLTTNLQQYQ